MEKIGKYEIVREIGLGGMGKVYEARDSVLGWIVAIKLMLEAQHLDEEMRARFYREAQAAGNLKHPNVVTIHDLAEENGVPYIVMEYLEGNDLKELLDKTEIDHLHAEIERDVQKYSQLASALCLKKQFDEAATAARQAMILDPESADVKRVLEHVRQGLARARHEKQALRMAKQARDLTKRGRRNEALDRIAGALALAPMDSEVRKIHEEIVGRVQGSEKQTVQATRTEARESFAEPAATQSSERPGAAREPEAVEQKPADEKAAAQPPGPRSPVPVSRAVVAPTSTPRPRVGSIRGSQRSPARRSPRWLYLPIAVSLILAAVVGLRLNRAAPAVVAPGFASMNISPWAEIRSLKNATKRGIPRARGKSNALLPSSAGRRIRGSVREPSFPRALDPRAGCAIR